MYFCFYLFSCLPIRVYVSVYLRFDYMYLCLPAFVPNTCLCFCLPVCQLVCLNAQRFVCLSTRLCISVSVCLSFNRSMTQSNLPPLLFVCAGNDDHNSLHVPYTSFIIFPIRTLTYRLCDLRI